MSNEPQGDRAAPAVQTPFGQGDDRAASPDVGAPVDRSDVPVRDEVGQLIAGVAELPLSEQVAVFETVHTMLSDQLSEPGA